MAGDEPVHYLQQQLEEQLRVNPAMLQFLQGAALDGMWYWDLENPDHEWMSSRFWETLGVDPSTKQHLTAEWQDLIHPDDLRTAIENFKAHYVDPDHPYDQIVRYRHRDGSTVWIRCRGMAIRNESGQPVRMLGAHTDVTAVKRAEEALAQANAELAAQNAALEHREREARQMAARLQTSLDDQERQRKELEAAHDKLAGVYDEMEQFVYTASHDLKSPLVTVLGYATQLKLDLGDGRTDRFEKFANYIMAAADRMRKNIDDLLELSRVGRVAHEAVPVDVHAAVTRLLSDHAVQIARAGATVTIDGDIPEVLADPDRLDQVFQNLISNAIRYGCSGEGAEIRIGGQRRGDEVRLFVADRGPGIPEKYREKVFQVFHRLETEGDGTGVGLATVKRIAEAHEGRIWIDDTPGGGATFWITFAANTAAEAYA